MLLGVLLGANDGSKLGCALGVLLEADNGGELGVLLGDVLGCCGHNIDECSIIRVSIKTDWLREGEGWDESRDPASRSWSCRRKGGGVRELRAHLLVQLFSCTS